MTARRPLTDDDLRHGTLTAYVYHGCRCPACAAVARDYNRDYKHRTGRRRPWARYVAERYPNGPTHGIRATYINGCRCEACRGAEARYKAGWRRRRSLSPKQRGEA